MGFLEPLVGVAGTLERFLQLRLEQLELRPQLFRIVGERGLGRLIDGAFFGDLGPRRHPGIVRHGAP